MSAFKFNEVVDVTVKGVRVVGEHDLTGALTVRDEHGDDYPMPPQAAVTRVAPAEWPPRPGDLWRDSDGYLWFASSHLSGLVGGGTRVVLLPQHADKTRAHRPENVRKDFGPLTLVHREDEQDGSAS